MKKFKDNISKYYGVTLNVYFIMLFLLLIVKCMGYDYFGIDVNNPLILKISDILENDIIKLIFQFWLLSLQLYYIVNISTRSNKNYKCTILLTILSLISQQLLYIFNLSDIHIFVSFTLIFITLKLFYKVKTLRIIKILILSVIFQIVSILIRTQEYNALNYFENLILSLDFILMLAIYNNILLSKGENVCLISKPMVGFQVFCFSALWTKLKSLVINLQISWINFKNLPKVDKIAFLIYTPIAILYNLLTFSLIILVAFLNETIIECLFIVIAFLSTKTVFGKSFHFDSAKTCFIVSNISYFLLNRITTHIGISILVPIMLGILLSYLTSFFVKEYVYKLYMGMSIDEFDNVILKVISKDCEYYKVCYDFYINKLSEVKLAHKYSYSVSGIKQIKNRIKKKLKELQ